MGCGALQQTTAATAVLLALVAGCGKPDGRAGLSGSVTLGGTALDSGAIELHPQGGGGPAGGAAIFAGRYVMPKTPGLMPGVYRVVIRAQAEPPDHGVQSHPSLAPDGAPPPAAKPPRSRIPPAFGDDSKLTVSLEAGKDNTLDVVIP
jgi:hypothetical protein